MKKGESPYDDVLREERRGKALALRKSGMSYREIGAELKIDPMTAHADLQACFRELKGTKESIEEQRDLELLRLDKYLRALELSIIGETPCEHCGRSDIKPIEAAVKIGKRRSELKGLDAPTKTQEMPADDVDKMSHEERAELHEKYAAEERSKAEAARNGQNGVH